MLKPIYFITIFALGLLFLSCESEKNKMKKFEKFKIDPKTLKGEIKFINSSPVYQKLTLNKSRFQTNDSIFGFIKYETKIDSSVTKHFQGYFKTKIN
ncbi:hypothetical protein SAMN06264346_101275 [Chryseobacterium profundimaris]|uniref:Lipoprotein n=2 Tax=Chryseobacterium profundimaris TaxID=1387275 RepID=A0ABY1N9K7_9FLAO|nr:hypothetical protein SAMN06264346_101275 [Chryseobacterium profundimaris]